MEAAVAKLGESARLRLVAKVHEVGQVRRVDLRFEGGFDGSQRYN